MKNSILAILMIFFSISLMQAQSQEEMRAWQEYMTPSDAHKTLALFDGKWHAVITMWMSPDQPPMKSEGTAMNEMIMDGRYQNSTFRADMMGMPFEGRSITAFDNATKTFKSIWIDNMGTGMMIMEGKMEEKSKILKMTGTMIDPMTGNPIEVREEMNFSNPKEQLFEMYMKHDGKEFKSMEILYQRIE